jgi:hypothetical protein
MKRVFVCLGLMVLLTGTAFNCAQGQSDKPPDPGTVYTGDALPTTELITKNYQHLGPECKNIQVIGIHKVNDVEYKIITAQTGSKAGLPDIIYDLWKLESREWVMVKPNIPVIQHIKVLNY